MNTHRKKLAGAGIVAFGAVAALFGGTGTAQAFVTANYNHHITGLGTTVAIADDKNPDGAVETCTYSSHVAGNATLFPYFATVTLRGKAPSNLPIYGVQTGTLYEVHINCPSTKSSTDLTERF